MDNADRKPGYFTYTHAGVAAFVPPGARRLLSLGCGAGATEAHLKQTFGLEEVVGVEYEPAIAEQARQVLDAVHTGDIEQLDLPYPAGHFDMILCLDVLEHLRDPWGVLRDKLTPVLASGGTIVVSVPNVRYWVVIWRLFWGRWAYAKRGILDIGHLRFFTPASARKMLVDAGFGSVEVRRKYRLFDTLGDVPTGQGVARAADAAVRRLAALRFLDYLPPIRDFFTFQIVLIGRKPGG